MSCGNYDSPPHGHIINTCRHLIIGTDDSPKPKSSATKKKGSKKVDKKSAKKYDIFDNNESSIFDDPLNAGGN